MEIGVESVKMRSEGMRLRDMGRGMIYGVREIMGGWVMG